MIARENSWQRKLFISGRDIPYEENFSESEFTRIRGGLVPGNMEDKWFVYFEEPFLYFHRSWTGEPVYRLRFRAGNDLVSVSEALCVADFLEQYGPGYQAKLLDFLISNLILGKSKHFPLPEGVDLDWTFQFSFSGTNYPHTRESM